ncbi:clathrin light chain [Acyrthosiphon pisum]|uniref:Clathrin light chain n=1 Tax=Acyrthosiphon pisum TaxID=7029 RepID=C4WUN1_ACYPI|nr:clathrin light chain [Acyrthosiphon pisum]BAH71601.1 ACYPI001943 [Acyrthosiphon pisum]|eukprot:NP_001280395.1 clathrin light chain [Acyrthosiphon pisum]
MDNFGDNFDDGDVDPAAEFLAREQTQLAGLEDDLSTPNVPIGVTQTLSNGSGSSFEIIDSAENQLTNPVIENGLTNGFTVTNSDDDTSSPIIAPKIEREEPEKIKKWREEQKTRLEEKDADEEKKKEELRLVAKANWKNGTRFTRNKLQKLKMLIEMQRNNLLLNLMKLSQALNGIASQNSAILTPNRVVLVKMLHV